MPYSQLPGFVNSYVADEWGIKTTSEENARFGGSVSGWPAFPVLQMILAHNKPDQRNFDYIIEKATL